jgi:hypothetical protein
MPPRRIKPPMRLIPADIDSIAIMAAAGPFVNAETDFGRIAAALETVLSMAPAF